MTTATSTHNVAANGKMFQQRRPATTGPKHPRQVEYEKRMTELDGRIAYLKARMDELKGVPRGADGTADGSTPRGKLINELKALREASRPLQEERRDWAKEAATLRETIKKRGGELKEAKEKLPFKSVTEIDGLVAQYEKQLETGSFKLSEEKQIVAEISKLNKARKALLALEAPSAAGKTEDLAAMKLRCDMLHDKIKARDAELDKSKGQIDGLSAKLDELNGTRASERLSREERNAQFTKLRAELDEAYEARRKAYEENRARAAAAHEAFVKRQAREKEEARCAEIEERIADLEERLAAHNPESLLDKKLAECNNMISFFKSLTGAPTEVTAPTQESKLAAPVGRTVTASEEIAGLEVVKKDDDDVFFMGGKTSKKKGGKSTSNGGGDHLGKLPLHILAGLADLNLTIPSTTEQAKILLDALDKVKAAIQTKKAELEASGEAQVVDPKMKALMDQIAALKIELAQKPAAVEEEAIAA